MSDRGFQLFEKEHAAGEAFDTFITSAAGALFAYIGQTYTPHKFDSWYAFVLPAALIFLTFCFYFGCKVLLGNKEVTRLNKEAVMAHEQCENITTQLNKFPHNPSFPSSLGQEVSRADMEQGIKILNKKMDDKKSAALATMADVEFKIKCRNICLVFGFILILVAKITQPYFEPGNDKSAAPVANAK